MSNCARAVLAHVGAGIGNVILSTPLFLALHELGYSVDVWLSGDYAQTTDLLESWSAIRSVLTDSSLDLHKDYAHIIPAIPPFYWRRYSRALRLVPRPCDSLFYQDEQEFYLSFARRIGYAGNRQPFLFFSLGRLPSKAL
jgi:hypothetical protein